MSMPNRRHNPSSTNDPPKGRDSVNVNPAGALAASASPGSNSRDNAATNRRIPVTSSWSSRPKEYTTFVREAFAAGSHSLWANCR